MTIQPIYLFLAFIAALIFINGFILLWAMCRLSAYYDAAGYVAMVKAQAEYDEREAKRQDTILAAQLEAMKAPEASND